ncbi:hypothetical protein [Paraburkholderia sp. J8-2]|uniref:hypothetical protein n=1 Tax=Paraburkholderia sp. J8-2 TaxID=2805440 RepID=UPI002AB6DDE9|nr:hypothetical protein [Paraburkholderia sp. J8-2]
MAQKTHVKGRQLRQVFDVALMPDTEEGSVLHPPFQFGSGDDNGSSLAAAKRVFMAT